MEGGTQVATNTLTTLGTALTTAFTTSEILGVIAQVVTAGATFVLMWFGARKLVYGIQKAVKKGKISI